jgi:replicative DNA helicase
VKLDDILKNGHLMNQPVKIKLPPHSKESEMMVLGCCLTSIDSLNAAASSLEEQDFYFSEHKIIFSVLEAAFRSDKPADLLLVSEELKRQDKLETVGGVAYLTTLAQYAGTSAYIEEYVSLIKNKSLLRRMIQASEMIEKSALDNPEDVDTLLDDAQKMFFQIGQASGSKVGVLISDVLMGAETRSNLPFLKELEARQERFAEKGAGELGITGMPTHFIDLDKIINGLNNSHLIILAARPAMGKTALALNIAEAVSFKNNAPVGIFSLEMTAEQLVGRIIASESEVEAEKIRTGALNAEEFQRVASAVSDMKEHVMIIDDTPGLKITDLRARARRMKESYNISLLVIDYLQLLSGSGSFKSVENRQNEISEISRMLKNLARELDIPILCIAQLSRKVEERTGHKPLMSDLRESGSIEQDADIIMLLLRRDYYDPNDRPGQAQLFVAKNRHGAIGDLFLTYRKEIAQFANYIPIMRANPSQEFVPQEVPTTF